MTTARASDPWAIDARDFPRDGGAAARFEFLLGYAILAPSGHNTQPWWFRAGGDGIEVHADRTRCLPVVDPGDRELTISCGAAIGHLEIALRYFGYEPGVQLLPDPEAGDLLARLRPRSGTGTAPDCDALFEAIVRRRTNRRPFRDEPVPDRVLDACRERAGSLGAGLRVVDERTEREAVAELVARGDRIQFRDKRFRRELAAWIHSHSLGSRDGISGAAIGMPDILSAAGGLALRTFDMGKGVAADDRERIDSGSPTLLALATEGDAAVPWLNAGRALARVLLTLTADGWSASYLNQPIEVDSLRPRLRETLGLGGQPQILLRCGRGDDPPPAARRPVAEVLMADQPGR